MASYNGVRRQELPFEVNGEPWLKPGRRLVQVLPSAL